MVKANINERRQSPRAKRVLSIEFSLAKGKGKDSDEHSHLSTTEDMSLGGLAFYTEHEYKKGDILNLRVVMSGVLDIFKGKARVVRMVKKRGNYFLVGVEFLDKPKRSRSAKSYSNTRKTTKKTSTKRL